MRTWIADYVSTEEIYWQVPGDEVDLTLLPSRAFDSAQEREQTQAIFADYAKTHLVGPELNARFDATGEGAHRAPSTALLRLAARVAHRRHVAASAHRDAAPRLALVGICGRHQDCVLATLWGVLNLLFIFAAVMGVVRGPRPRYLALMLLFVLLRSAFLGTLENPEPRYTLECYPVVLLLGRRGLSGGRDAAGSDARDVLITAAA